MDYTEQKLPELKQLCKDKNLKSTGKKVDLIARLEEYDTKQREEEAKFKVFVKTFMGSFYTIYLERDSTVLELKEKIEEKNGCPVDKQKLFFRKYKGGSITNPTCVSEQKLEDDKTLSFYNIYKESTINLQISLR